MSRQYRHEPIRSARGYSRIRSIRARGHIMRVGWRGRGPGKILEVLHPLVDNPCNPPGVEDGVPERIYPKITNLRGIKEDGHEYEHPFTSKVESIAAPDESALSTPTGEYPLADGSLVLTTKLGKARLRRAGAGLAAPDLGFGRPSAGR